MGLLPPMCSKCGQLLPTDKDRDLGKEVRQWRRRYNRLAADARRVSENFTLYDSQINVVVAMDLIERLQATLATDILMPDSEPLQTDTGARK